MILELRSLVESHLRNLRHEGRWVLCVSSHVCRWLALVVEVLIEAVERSWCALSFRLRVDREQPAGDVVGRIR